MADEVFGAVATEVEAATAQTRRVSPPLYEVIRRALLVAGGFLLVVLAFRTCLLVGAYLAIKENARVVAFPGTLSESSWVDPEAFPPHPAMSSPDPVFRRPYAVARDREFIFGIQTQGLDGSGADASEESFVVTGLRDRGGRASDLLNERRYEDLWQLLTELIFLGRQEDHYAVVGEVLQLSSTSVEDQEDWDYWEPSSDAISTSDLDWDLGDVNAYELLLDGLLWHLERFSLEPLFGALERQQIERASRIAAFAGQQLRLIDTRADLNLTERYRINRIFLVEAFLADPWVVSKYQDSIRAILRAMGENFPASAFTTIEALHGSGPELAPYVDYVVGVYSLRGGRFEEAHASFDRSEQAGGKLGKLAVLMKARVQYWAAIAADDQLAELAFTPPERRDAIAQDAREFLHEQYGQGDALSRVAAELTRVANAIAVPSFRTDLEGYARRVSRIAADRRAEDAPWSSE